MSHHRRHTGDPEGWASTDTDVAGLLHLDRSGTDCPVACCVDDHPVASGCPVDCCVDDFVVVDSDDGAISRL